MKIHHLRHAAMILTYAGRRILVDPMLSDEGASNPIPTRDPGKGRRNPITALPVHREELLSLINTLDAVLVTHTHGDHWDDAGKALIPKYLPILCQAEDQDGLKQLGFKTVIPITQEARWSKIQIHRYPAYHGGFLIRRKMGVVSGFTLQAKGEPTLYIAGDTIWCQPVKTAIRQVQPEVIIIYSGAAQLPYGRSITMNEHDVTKVCQAAPHASIVAVHMEAINHCLLTRDELRNHLANKSLAHRVIIPQNGETVEL